MHKGDLHGGKYWTFLRPRKYDEWFKFLDETVTNASLKEVFNDSFDGTHLFKEIKGDFVSRIRPMLLIYIRVSMVDNLLK